VKYVFANTTAQREERLNPHANTPTAVKMNEINPKYENTPAINQSKSILLTYAIFFLYIKSVILVFL
jgi:hypothetical protein